MNNSKKTILWAVLFALSIMANMFFLGMMAGHGFRHSHMMPPGGPMGGSPIAHMLNAARDLPDSDKEIVESVFAKYEAQSRLHMRALHKAFGQLRNVLTSPDYKEADLIEAHKMVAKADETTKADIESAMIEIAGKLNPESRAQFFKNMLPPLPDHKTRGDKDFEDEPTEAPDAPVN